MAEKDKKNTTEFSFEIMAAIIALLGGTIPSKGYDMMSALDGKRSASAFQHQFRAVIKRAKQLKEEYERNGGSFAAVTPAPKGAKRGKPTASKVSGKVVGSGGKGKKRSHEDDPGLISDAIDGAYYSDDDDDDDDDDDGGDSKKRVKMELKD